MPDQAKVEQFLKNIVGHIKEVERHLANLRNDTSALLKELNIAPERVGIDAAPTVQRESQRARVSLPVTYKIKGKAGMRKRINTVDISQGGARIVLFKNDPVNVGEVLEMEIFLPDKEDVLTTEAEVTRVFNYEDPNRTGHEIGVKFTTLPDLGRAAIERIVRQSAQKA